MSIYDEIRAEREYQDNRWGGGCHDDEHDRDQWFDFILDYARGNRGERRGIGDRHRLIVIAALAVAAIEVHDRADEQDRISQGWDARDIGGDGGSDG